jgi:hypothetical protein
MGADPLLRGPDIVDVHMANIIPCQILIKPRRRSINLSFRKINRNFAPVIRLLMGQLF